MSEAAKVFIEEATEQDKSGMRKAGQNGKEAEIISYTWLKEYYDRKYPGCISIQHITGKGKKEKYEISYGKSKKDCQIKSKNGKHQTNCKHYGFEPGDLIIKDLLTHRAGFAEIKTEAENEGNAEERGCKYFDDSGLLRRIGEEYNIGPKPYHWIFTGSLATKDRHIVKIQSIYENYKGQCLLDDGSVSKREAFAEQILLNINMDFDDQELIVKKAANITNWLEQIEPTKRADALEKFFAIIKAA